MKYFIKINDVIWQEFDCTSHLNGVLCDRARNEIVNQTRARALKMQSDIFEKSEIGIKVTCEDDSGHIYACGKKTYSDDSEVWNRSCDTDDAFRLLRAIICRAILDERSQGPSMNAADIAAHESYMSRPDGLEYDCDLIDIDFNTLLARLEEHNG